GNTWDEAVEALWQADLADATTNVPMDQWPRPSGNAGGDSIMRLREGVERFLITDINNPAASAMAQSDVAVMFDSVAGGRLDASQSADRFNHVPGGANVLYMDGHVEFRRYPAEDHPVDVVHGMIGRPSS
ncbi:MAG: hypothetical protein R6W89_08840, partial [Candidatus Hydrogenedentota bacterium]